MAALLFVPLLITLSAPAAAAALDPIADAVQAFKSGEHVYVDPSAEEAGKVDAATLRTHIAESGQPIYIAVLPNSASPSPDGVARQIGQLLGGRVTVAVLVGTHFRAGSSALPAGRGATLATQAFDEGNGDVNKTLILFVDKVAATAKAGATPFDTAGAKPPPTQTQTQKAGTGGLVTILVLLLLIGVLGGFGLWWIVRRSRQGKVDALRAEAQRWYERLGGDVLNLSAGGNDSARQALADAAERYNAAGSTLAQATTEAGYRSARDTALEGLHYARAARTSLGMDPGPELPPTSVQAAAGRIQRDHTAQIGDQQIQMRPAYAPDAPYYYPGGTVGGGRVPGGWYSQPFWKTALIGGAAGIGGLLVADALFDAVRGPFYGGWGAGGMMGGGYDAGYNQGFESGYDPGSDSSFDDSGGGDWGGGGDFGGGDFGGGGDF